MQAVVEKASIDEVYIDVTSMVDAELHQQRLSPSGGGTQGYGPAHSSQEEEDGDSPSRQARSGGQPQGNNIEPGAAAAAAAAGAFTSGPFSWGSIVLGGQLQDNEFERRLGVGAAIGCRLRGAVREQLGVGSNQTAQTPPLGFIRDLPVGNGVSP